MTTIGTKKQKPATEVLTPEFRVSYPFVFEPRAAQPGDKKLKYSVQMLFRVKPNAKNPHEKVVDIEELVDAAEIALTDKWGHDKAKWPKNLYNPFRDGAERGDKEGYGDGVAFVSASSEYKPGVVDQQLKDIIDRNLLYPGCYARAYVAAFTWEYMGKAGVGFGLRHIQLIRDGEPLGGGNKAADAFDAIPLPGESKPLAQDVQAGNAAKSLFGDLG